jgi:thioesterase domain-containing protein
MNAEQLEQTIRAGIPISAAMDFRVRGLDEYSIEVSGGGQENINVHHTAFAGSLYTICTLAAWGLIYSALPADCALVMAKADIQYLRPVEGDIVASAMLIEEQKIGLLDDLKARGKARISIVVSIYQQQKLAVSFNAHMYVKYQK